MTQSKKQKKHQLAMSSIGGRATVAKYGVEYMREIARRGAAKRRAKREAEAQPEPQRAQAVAYQPPKKKSFFKRLFK